MMIVQILSTVLLLGIGVLVQIALSKCKNPFAGWILPVMTFLASFLVPLNMTVPTTGMTFGFAVYMLGVFLLCNIPTAVFLAICFACRQRMARVKELDKMNVQDLD